MTAPRLVQRTATIRLRLTRRQAGRCYGLLRSAGDVWAWLLDTNQQRRQQCEPAISNYQALCRLLTAAGPFGELSVAGARSVLRRYSDAWFEAAKRRGQAARAGFPRRKRALVPVRFYHGTFLLDGSRVRLPVAKGRLALWVRLARPLPYPPEQVRAVTLLADGGRLWLAVTAAVPIQQHDLDSDRVAGVDLGIIHPFAVVTQDAGLLVSGRAIRAENYLHLKDQQVRRAGAAGQAPRRGLRGSRRWRRHRAHLRRVEARHRRRVHQAHHQAAKQVVAFALQQRLGTLVVGDSRGITKHDAGRVQNWRLRQWRRTHLLQALRDKARQAGIAVRLVDERGTSSTCPACRQRVPKPKGRRFSCPHCRFQGHRDLVGAHNIAAISTMLGGGSAWPRATIPTILRRVGVARWASPTWRLARITQGLLSQATLREGAQEVPSALCGKKGMNRSRLASASRPWVGPPTRGRSPLRAAGPGRAAPLQPPGGAILGPRSLGFCVNRRYRPSADRGNRVESPSKAPGAPMDFRILGPLVVEIDGERVQLGPKLGAVLTLLLLHANRGVPAAELQAVLGSTGRTPTRATLRSHIHHLRLALQPRRPEAAAPATLETAETGYLLRVQPERLDTVRFQRLVEEGRRALDAGDPATAAERLHAALALWRGPIPDHVATSPSVQDEVARLEGLYLTAREARVQADLDLGRHAELLPELELLTAQQPDHEGLRRLLALALYRSQRVDEAAETCRRGITRLLARGLHAPALQQLQTAILRRAAELDWTPPTPAHHPPRPYLLPTDVASFTDRRAELAFVHDTLRADGATTPPAAVLAIDGNPGIGKSALAVHAAHQLAPHFPDGVLYANLRGEDEQPATAAAVLDYFLRALGVPDQDLPADLRVAAARYRSELAGRRVLVVLDNAASEAQVRALLPGTPGSAAILTSRARLALHEAVPLTLDLLDEDDAVRLLARLDQEGRVDAEPAAGRRVARACGRLPLALQIAGARLGNRRTWTVAHLANRLADERQRLGELRVGDLDVRASFALSYRDLPAAEARTFRLLGLLETPDTTPGPVAALIDSAVGDAEATLERLLDGRLLEQTHPGRYRLHDLLRLFAREQAEAQEPAEQQDAARARTLRWYLANAEHADRLLGPAGQQSPTAPAGPFPDRAAALAWLDDERANLVAATRQAAAHPDPAVAAVAWRLGDALFRYFDLRKHWSAWQAVCEPAVDAARRAGTPVDQARALNRLGMVYREQRRLPEAMAQQQQALAIIGQAGDPDVEGSILNNLGITYQDQRDYPAAIACHRRRLAIARRLGDRYSQGVTLNNLGDVYRDQGRYPDATTCLEQSLAIFRELHDRRALAMVLNNLGEVASAQGRFQEAISHHRQGSTISHEVGDRYSQAINLLGLGHAVAAAHDRPAALPHWRDALAILSSLQAPEADEVRALVDDQAS